MESLTTPALLARVVDYGEADRICDLITRDAGRISAMARGARRSRRRFGGALSLFVLGEATVTAPRPGRSLGVLERFDSLRDFSAGMSRDVVKAAHGSYVLELARELLPEAQPEPDAFDLLTETLELLSSGPPSPPLLRAVELKLLRHHGTGLSLSRCVACGREMEAGEPARLDAARGGVTCWLCAGTGEPLEPAARTWMDRLDREPLAWAANAQPPPEVSTRIRNSMMEAVRLAVGKNLKSLDFIVSLASAGRARASRGT